MSLFYAVVFFSVSAILGRAAYVGSRLPRRPWWARESLITSLLIIIVGMLAFGIAHLSSALLAWESQDVGIAEVAGMAGIAMAAAVIWVLAGRMLPVPTDGTVVPLPRTGQDRDATERRAPAPAESPGRGPRRAA